MSCVWREFWGDPKFARPRIKTASPSMAPKSRSVNPNEKLLMKTEPCSKLERPEISKDDVGTAAMSSRVTWL